MVAVDSPDAAEAAEAVLRAVQEGRGIVSALVLEGPAEGRRRLVTDRKARGSLGEPELEAAIDALARKLLAGETPGLRGRDAGTRRVTVGEREVAVYFERALPEPGLLVVGAGHLAGPLVRLGRLLGFRVTVGDDRPGFVRRERFPEASRILRMDFSDPFRDVPPRDRTHVVLVTRGHRYDYECLRRLLAEEPPPVYVGMIGSRRRVRATFHQLRDEGVSASALSRVRAPVGLDLGAETPEEIAVAVAAEWVVLRRGGSCRPLAEVERVAERFFPDDIGADADPDAAQEEG